ncbi:branched-chain amino acid:cation transporter, LIVCS family [Muriicola jejuensis]|uniref:Branched-chain amino acid ABC transporter substrate-binding protein n=1 Tax=Muriicola jejuensis TaxID=504488 RepID=A0A6P0UI43_9FLAO|nr:branched-chain amino acid transport system II carrier protein [Muriicola jejuensis]NER09846.1 branched-chain amino acid ABC transporter substrate-binding protein [Muriicola jejuensis]SMP05256.1 branched-chain amino acid:cation transporter, LIVCS family [Muriicola jejuensis]
MRQFRELLVTAFALFSLFFGAGNLILPPLLGFKAGPDWWLVALGFAISGVLIAILGIRAHARLQGTIFDFGSKVSPLFSLVYCYLVYAIAIGLPSPRTASVTHEMAIAPFFEVGPLTTSFIYFGLVLIFALNRNKILDIIGKLMTPAILLILLCIMGVIIFTSPFEFGEPLIMYPFSYSILEGYQTFDAIGAVVVGGVIIVSINLKNNKTYEEKRKLIANAGWLAGLTLLLVYAGLMLSAALMQSDFETDISRTALLQGMSYLALGPTGRGIFSVLVALACFTTAVGIVTGTADFVKSRFSNSQRAYVLTAAIGSLLGVLMGQLEVGYIIDVALPALMFIYPITIVLIILNVLPERWASAGVFKSVVWVTILFSVPDFLQSLDLGTYLKAVNALIPLSGVQLGWVIPATLTFLVLNARKFYFK